MTKTIQLAAIPNQTFNFSSDQTFYQMRIFLAVNVMCADVAINGVQVLTSQRLVSGSLIIPYPYLFDGNFLISTLNDELPIYTQFNITQFLIYYSQAELQALANE